MVGLVPCSSYWIPSLTGMGLVWARTPSVVEARMSDLQRAFDLTICPKVGRIGNPSYREVFATHGSSDRCRTSCPRLRRHFGCPKSPRRCWPNRLEAASSCSPSRARLACSVAEPTISLGSSRKLVRFLPPKACMPLVDHSISHYGSSSPCPPHMKGPPTRKLLAGEAGYCCRDRMTTALSSLLGAIGKRQDLY